MRVTVIIPTRNAEAYIDSLLSALEKQSVVIDETIVIDSESSDDTLQIARKHKNVKIMEIARKEFSHGGTRDLAFRESKGEIVCFLTQDALPANEFYIENLIRPFLEDSDIAMSYGRQVARENATIREKLTKELNYPEVSSVREKKDIEKLGIRAFFVTNVCSAYRRDAYLEVGGFDRDAIVNEDMEICAKFLRGGKKVAYLHNAVVLHSHNHTLLQHFKRNFDIAVFFASHRDIFKNISEYSEGWLLFKKVFLNLLLKLHFLEAGLFILKCVFDILGHMAGKKYKALPVFFAKKMSAQKVWWERK